MIEPKLEKRILGLTTKFWKDCDRIAELNKLAQGKERGHRIANHVDELTTEHLHTQITDSRYESGIKGIDAIAATDGDDISEVPDGNPADAKKPRSMGDIWVLSNDMYNPINIKTGISGNYGRPNMVSMRRLLVTLLEGKIDSYYLLFVKLKLGTDKRSVEACRVHLVDMLDYLQFIVFNAGPGQIMLREREFFVALESGSKPLSPSRKKKVTALFKMYEEGIRDLIDSRRRSLKGMSSLMKRHEEKGRKQRVAVAGKRSRGVAGNRRVS